jgi:hypothetical protein
LITSPMFFSLSINSFISSSSSSVILGSR